MDLDGGAAIAPMDVDVDADAGGIGSAAAPVAPRFIGDDGVLGTIYNDFIMKSRVNHGLDKLLFCFTVVKRQCQQVLQICTNLVKGKCSRDTHHAE